MITKILWHFLYSSPHHAMAKGTKRASPGAEDEKDPLQAVELDEENAKKLNENQRATQRVELYLGKCYARLPAEIF